MVYVCLAAGKGTRFGKLGFYLQKCMYPVGLKPFLEYSLQNLLATGSVKQQDELVLVVGHFREQLRQYFGEAFEGLKIRYLEQLEPLGTGHALFLAYQVSKPAAPVLAWLADSYIPTKLFREVLDHPEVNVQTIAPGHDDEKQDLRVTTRADLVVRAWQGSEDYYDMGLWKLSPGVLSMMVATQHGEYRMVPNLQLAIDRGHRLGFVRWAEWLHLGGTLPSPELNVRAVCQRVLELEERNDHR